MPYQKTWEGTVMAGRTGGSSMRTKSKIMVILLYTFSCECAWQWLVAVLIFLLRVLSQWFIACFQSSLDLLTSRAQRARSTIVPPCLEAQNSIVRARASERVARASDSSRLAYKSSSKSVKRDRVPCLEARSMIVRARASEFEKV